MSRLTYYPPIWLIDGYADPAPFDLTEAAQRIVELNSPEYVAFHRQEPTDHCQPSVPDGGT
jgi:hypothetical protein